MAPEGVCWSRRAFGGFTCRYSGDDTSHQRARGEDASIVATRELARRSLAPKGGWTRGSREVSLSGAALEGHRPPIGSCESAGGTGHPWRLASQEVRFRHGAWSDHHRATDPSALGEPIAREVMLQVCQRNRLKE
jgi:hypothetical protein